MEPKNGLTLCFTSCKGGVGKTTTALYMAGIYHLLNQKVLLIDLDVTSGALALSLNVNIKKDIYDLVEDLKINKYESFTDYVAKYNDNIDVLGCPLNPKNAFKLDIEYLNNILTVAKTRYDVIIIDTTHTLNELNLLLFDIVDLILFIITNDFYDLKNTKNMLTILNEAKINKYKIVLNESQNCDKNYFSSYDIKKIISANIDYVIPKTFYIKEIDKYIVNHEILVLNKVIADRYKQEIEKLTVMAKSILNNKRGG